MLAPEIHGLFIASLIIFIGFIGSVLLNRHNIPDAIFLIILGYVLGPLLNIVDVNTLSGVAPILGALALIAIMFESSFGINMRELALSAKSTLILASVGFLISTVVTYLFLYYVIGFYPENPYFSLMVGTIVGGGSGAIIASIVQRLNVPSSIQVALSIESVLTDVFVIIFTSVVAFMIININIILNLKR
jgi:NhaP-type Na+/H+ or K+/H+ antiporter